MKRIAVVASGRGSNFQAVIDAIRDGKVPAECVALITDNPKAYAIERAQKAGIPCRIIDYTTFPSREVYERALLASMQEVNADLFVLAGYMRILGSSIVRAFPGKDDQYPPCSPARFYRSPCPAAGGATRGQGGRLHRAFR